MVNMSEIEGKDFVLEDNNRQFLVISAKKICKTNVMELLSVEEGNIITIFSPPRRFEKTMQLEFRSSTDPVHNECNLIDINYDSYKLFKPLIEF